MQIITPAQCRAARALLNWSQPELAERCAIHVQTISNFEKESSSPSKKTLQKILETFIDANIEFTSGDGTKRIENQVKLYKGQKGFIDFKYDVYETVKNGGHVYVSNVDENEYVKWDGIELQSHIERMKSIKNLNFLILVKEGDQNFPASTYAKYRWVPESNFGNISHYIYGNKTAFISFEKDTVNIFVIQNPSIAEFFRRNFLLSWESALTAQ